MQAEEHDLPINALINKILIKNTFNEQILNVIPSISIPHMLFEKLIDHIDDTSLKKLVSTGQPITKKYFSLINKNHILENVIEDYFVVLGKYSVCYQRASNRFSTSTHPI